MFPRVAPQNDEIVPTLNGANVTIHIPAPGRVYVDDARVIAADNYASNGVVHIIDVRCAGLVGWVLITVCAAAHGTAYDRHVRYTAHPPRTLTCASPLT